MKYILLFVLLIASIYADQIPPDSCKKTVLFGSADPITSETDLLAFVNSFGEMVGEMEELTLNKEGITGSIKVVNLNTGAAEAVGASSHGLGADYSNQLDLNRKMIIDLELEQGCIANAQLRLLSMYQSFDQSQGNGIKAQVKWNTNYNGEYTQSGQIAQDLTNADNDDDVSTNNLNIPWAFTELSVFAEAGRELSKGEGANFGIQYIEVEVDLCCDLNKICYLGEYFNHDEGNCDVCLEKCNACKNADTCTSCVDQSRTPPHCECGEGKIDNNGVCESINLCVEARYETVTTEECEVCKLFCEDCDYAGYFTNDMNEALPDGCIKSCKPCAHVDEPKPVCVDCPAKCGKCQTTCKECKDPMRSLEDDCECTGVTYDFLGEACPPCDPECASCDTSGVCTKCKESDPERVFPYCECPEGYYEEDGTCKKCGDDCATCDNGDSCTSCLDDMKEGDQCECPDGYYLNEENNRCIKCQEKCLTCSGPETCTECTDPDRTIENNCDCPNVPPTFDKDGKSCNKCEERCSRCNGPEICEQCINQKGGRSGPPACECPEGTIDVRGEDCVKCNFICKTCQDTPETCKTCTDPNRSPETGCKCVEPKTYDYKGETCKSCKPFCATCENGEECKTCIDPDNRKIPNCDCYPGKYNYNNQCLPCQKNCATCNNGTTCLTCKDSENRHPELCECKEKYYDNAGECLPLEECSVIEFHGFNGQNDDKCTACKIMCQTCPENDKCTPSCDEAICTQEDLDANANCKAQGCEVYCSDDCQNEFCEDCDPSCKTCIEKGSCLSCKSDDFRTTPTCLCIDGYYDPDLGYDAEGQECLQCHASCATCDGPNDNHCLTCPEGSSVNANGQCAPTAAGFLEKENKVIETEAKMKL